MSFIYYANTTFNIMPYRYRAIHFETKLIEKNIVLRHPLSVAYPRGNVLTPLPLECHENIQGIRENCDIEFESLFSNV